MFVLNSKINIGKYSNVKPFEVTIEKSVYSYVDRVAIKIPIRARIDRGRYLEPLIIHTADEFKEGMKVVINLGYNGKLKQEFVGFVNRVNFASPLEIECEGYSYQLRKRSYTQSFKNVTLKDILKALVQGTDILLDESIDDIPISKFILGGQNGTEALEKLKKHLHNTISFRFIGNVLIAELFPIKAEKGIVKYRLGWNVIKDNDLKKRTAQNTNVIVHFDANLKDGTQIRASKSGLKSKVITTVGSSGVDGEVKHYKSDIVQDKNALDKLATAKHSMLTFDGFEGRITTFLQPYCEPGWKAILEDTSYPERNGAYIIQSVKVTYGLSGARRIVEIGMKLN